MKLFARKTADAGPWETIAWWEARRIPYNLLVGATGLVSGAMCLITGILCEHFLGQPIGIPDPPIFALLGVAAYGVMANLCYTGGWMAELLVQKIWPGKGNEFGRISFSLGLGFSILLTLVPGILFTALGALSLLGHFVGK
ncbi:MAG TPA: hypothetical protein VF532_13540 [Candidatus Angelobacter sp.]